MNNKILTCIALLTVACGDDDGGRDSAASASMSASDSASATDTMATDSVSDSAAEASDSATDTAATATATETATGTGATTGATTTGDTMETDSATSTTGTTTGATATAGSTTGPMCGPEFFSFQFQPKTPNVMLALDKSRSMSQLWDHDGDPNTATISRWNSLHTVVSTFSTMFQAEMNLGAQLFPSAAAYLDEPQNLNSCLVEDPPEVSVGPNNAANILAAMPAANDFSISGGTPATAGFTSALDHLLAQDPEIPRVIVMLTDGAANCNPNEAADQTLFVYDADLPVAVADAWANESIPTYVVGINILDELGTKPAVNPKDALVELANAGGVPKPGLEPFYNTFNEQELGDAINEIAAKIECTISLDSEPVYPDDVLVEIDGLGYGKVTDCANQNGWSYTNDNGPYNAIELCGAACDALQTAGSVDVIYACP